MAQDDQTDPISSELAEFITFFQSSMADVTFPDVDAGTLAALAQTVRDQASELERLNEQVRSARDALDDAERVLRKQTQKGLAYARVYAGGNDRLTAELAELEICRDDTPSKPRRRKSKTKAKNKAKAKAEPSDEPTGELPFVESKSEAA